MPGETDDRIVVLAIPYIHLAFDMGFDAPNRQCLTRSVGEVMSTSSLGKSIRNQAIGSLLVRSS